MRGRAHDRRRRAGQRGAVATEALVLLPFFCVVWACMFFVHRLHERRQVEQASARTCALARTTSSCLTPPLPGCAFEPVPEIPEQALHAHAPQLGRLEGRLATLGLDLPALFGPFFPPLFRLEREASVGRPTVMGGGEVAIARRASGMCNEVPMHARPKKERITLEDAYELFNPAWCKLTGWC